MYPVNQVILGGDSMFNGMDDIDAQIQKMEAYRNKLQQLRASQAKPKKLVWDDIDAEIAPLTEEQRNKLFLDEDYVESYNKIQSIVQAEILNLVKSKIEGTPEGKELLEKQLRIIKKLKGKIVEETNKEMEIFKRFKEYSKANPNGTYEDFIKANV